MVLVRNVIREDLGRRESVPSSAKEILGRCVQFNSDRFELIWIEPLQAIPVSYPMQATLDDLCSHRQFVIRDAEH